MPQNRPAIPAKTRRKVLTDAGHCCSTCGESLTLELAHIVPFSKTGDHSEENLICLCANCHAKADLYNWDRQTFLHYKHNPWINRKKGNDGEPKSKRSDSEVWIRLNGRLTDFTKVSRDQFRYMLAGFLHIPAEDVVIEDTYEGSIVVRLRLPGEAAEKLIDSWNLERDKLLDTAAEFKINAVHPADVFDDTAITSWIKDAQKRKVTREEASGWRRQTKAKITSILERLLLKRPMLLQFLFGGLVAVGSYQSWAHTQGEGMPVFVLLIWLALFICFSALVSLIHKMDQELSVKLISDSLSSFDEFKAIADRSSHAIFCKDNDRKFVYANMAFARMMHAFPADLIGRTDAELYGVQFQEAYRETDDLVLRGMGVALAHHVWDFAGYQEKKYLAVTKLPFSVAQGRVRGVCVVFSEIFDKGDTWQKLIRMENTFLHNQQFLKQIEQRAGSGRPPQLFVAYKHGNEAVQNWVKKLAFELTTEFKLPCILDQFDLHYGDSIDEYMRQIETKATHVILVITKESSRALQERTGMVTFEAQLAEKLHKSGKLRLIPLLRNGDVPPGCIKDIVYVDFRDDALYRDTLLQLVRSIKFINVSRSDPPLPLSG